VRPLILVLGALTACVGTDSAAPPDRTRADAADLILTSPDTGGLSFDRIGAVLTTRDSLVIVSLPMSRQFLVFTASGELLRVFGRRGSGPGELTAVGAIGLVADSLWVYDPVADRLTLYLPRSGATVRTRQVGLRLTGWPGSASILALLQDGSLLVEGRHSITGLVLHATPPAIPVSRVDPGGRVLQSVGIRNLEGWAFSAKTVGGGIQGIQPFAAIDRVAAATDGSRFAFVAARDDGIHVRMYQANGDQVYSLPLPLAGDPLTDGRVDSALRHLGPPLSSLPRGTLRRPVRLPAVSRAIVGDDGSLWLQLDPPVLNRVVSRWALVAPDGRSLDTVAMLSPRILARPTRAGYWAIELDSLDVPRLARYSFDRRANPGQL
jgi:hypothetical protein